MESGAEDALRLREDGQGKEEDPEEAEESTSRQGKAAKRQEDPTEQTSSSTEPLWKKGRYSREEQECLITLVMGHASAEDEGQALLDVDDHKVDWKSFEEEMRRPAFSMQQHWVRVAWPVLAKHLKGDDYTPITKKESVVFAYEAVMKRLELEKGAAKAKEEDQMTRDVKTSRGIKLFNKGKFDKALRFYDKSIDLAQPSSSLYCLRASCHIQLQQFPEAKADAARSVELDPKNVTAYVILIQSSVLLGDIAAAEEAIDRASALDPENAEVEVQATKIRSLDRFIKKARKAFDRGDYAKYLKYLEKSHAVSSACNDLEVLKADCLRKMQRQNSGHNILVWSLNAETEKRAEAEDGNDSVGPRPLQHSDNKGRRMLTPRKAKETTPCPTCAKPFPNNQIREHLARTHLNFKLRSYFNSETKSCLLCPYISKEGASRVARHVGMFHNKVEEFADQEQREWMESIKGRKVTRN